MTPKGGHVQPAHAEPRIGRSHEFHHFAGGLPAATFVGERTFRWRRVGSNPCDYIHAPLPRRERVAALLTLRPGTVQCNRAGIRGPHDSTSVPTCKRMKRRGFRLTPISFDRGILACIIRSSGVRFCDGLRVQPMPDNLAPGSAAWLTQVPGRVLSGTGNCRVHGIDTCMRQQRVLSASRPVPAEGCCYPNAALPTVVPRGLLRRRMWVVGLRQPQTHVSAIEVYHCEYASPRKSPVSPVRSRLQHGPRADDARRHDTRHLARDLRPPRPDRDGARPARDGRGMVRNPAP